MPLNRTFVEGNIYVKFFNPEIANAIIRQAWEVYNNTLGRTGGDDAAATAAAKAK